MTRCQEKRCGVVMRKSGLAEKYVRIVQDMYDDSTTAVRCGQDQE